MTDYNDAFNIIRSLEREKDQKIREINNKYTEIRTAYEKKILISDDVPPEIVYSIAFGCSRPYELAFIKSSDAIDSRISYDHSKNLGQGWWILRGKPSVNDYLIHLCMENKMGYKARHNSSARHRLRVMLPKRKKCPACGIAPDPAILQLFTLQTMKDVR